MHLTLRRTWPSTTSDNWPPSTCNNSDHGPAASRRPADPRNSHHTEGIDMTHLQSLRDLGQSLWLDNITREILDDGTLPRYIDEYGIPGLTSNPTIFDQAIGDSSP